MKKRIIAVCLMLAILGVAFVCCRKTTASSKNEDLEETAAVETEIAYTTVPGLELNDFEESDFEDAEATEAKEEATEETTEATEAKTEETEGNNEETKPSETEPTTPATSPTEGSTVTSFEWYNALSGAQQQEFMNSFDSVEAFFAWYNAAKSEHEAQNPNIEINGGSVDLGGMK